MNKVPALVTMEIERFSILEAMMQPDSLPWLFEAKLADLVAPSSSKPDQPPKPPKKDQAPIDDAPPGPEPEGPPNMLDKLKLLLNRKNGDPPKP